MPNFIKIGRELFEIIDIKTHTHTHTDRQTHRHIHADENNTCPKTKFLGQVIISRSKILDLVFLCYFLPDPFKITSNIEI